MYGAYYVPNNYLFGLTRTDHDIWLRSYAAGVLVRRGS